MTHHACGPRMRLVTLLLFWVAVWGLVAGEARAQVVRFLTPEVGDRRVILRWNPVPGDTLDRDARQDCLARCRSCCRQVLFGGYQIWRSTTPNPDKMVLLRTYSIFDSTWTFRAGERVFADPDSVIVRGCGGVPVPGGEDVCDPLTGRAVAPFNGFKYYYAITYFDSKVDTIAGGARIVEVERQSRADGLLADPVQPTPTCATVTPLLANVRVVPNPFKPSDAFKRASFGDENRVQFINLPCPATVRIYTAAGDLVNILRNESQRGSIDWDLRNGNGDDVIGGIYMYVVESAGGKQSRSGHFVIIR